MTNPQPSHAVNQPPQPMSSPPPSALSSSVVPPPLSRSALPPERRRSWFARNRLFVLVPLAVVVVAGAVLATVMRRGGREPYAGPTWKVDRQKLQFTIVERGTLESAENSDIVCRVKAGTKGSTIATTIKWIVDDGTQVVKGQKLIELDDSGLYEQLKTQNNTVNQSRSAWISAKENLSIVESQNFSDIESAKVTKNLAEIDLKKFVGVSLGVKLLAVDTREDLQNYLRTAYDSELRGDAGAVEKATSDFLMTLNDIEGRIQIARSDREMNLDRASWSQRMVKKGYYSRSQSDADQARFDSSEINLRKVQGELDIFRKFTMEKNVTELWSKVKEADRAVDRVKTQAKAKVIQGKADLDAKLEVYRQDESKQQEIRDEIAKCLLLSPQDGMVVYYIPEQSRFGGGSQQSTIAQGEPVREGQKLMRIPNLEKMLVNTRVHEAMVTKLKGEVLKPTYFTEKVRGGFLACSTNPYMAMATLFASEELRDDFKERDSIQMYPGQRCMVRVEGYPDKQYRGNIKTVATVASQADFFSSDVRVYQTMISINEMVENLKPGMSAEVTILADEASAPVLVIPIQAVVGNLSMGSKRKCFILDDNKIPQERDIEVGMSNDKLIEVRTGLEEG
jgi:HlyD family secretion protein